MIHVDFEYLDLATGLTCGYLDYNKQDVEENGFDTLLDAIEETRYSIDEADETDVVQIFSFYDGMDKYPDEPCYTIARCSEEQGRRLNVVADEFYGHFIEDLEEEMYEPF